MGIFDMFTPKAEPAPVQPATAAPLVPGQPIVDPAAQPVPPNQGNIPGAPTVQATPGAFPLRPPRFLADA